MYYLWSPIPNPTVREKVEEKPWEEDGRGRHRQEHEEKWRRIKKNAHTLATSHGELKGTKTERTKNEW